MPFPKTHKAEKITTDRLAGETLEVVAEMLDIIVARTKLDSNDQTFIHTGNELKYFGVGHQLKISKLADTLYSTMKDVLVYVMSEMAKESEVDYKFQVPKHTSFVGAVVKSVGIDVIARNEDYKEYLDALCHNTGKYAFDINQEVFQNLYKDTVLKLEDRGFLFDDDPELINLKRLMKGLPQLDNPISHNNPLESISISADDIIPAAQNSTFTAINIKDDDGAQNEEDMELIEDIENIKANSRNRIIFPYLRRLFETHKAAVVTKKRVDSISAFCEPDDEIKRAFDEKFKEVLSTAQEQLNASSEVVRGHCVFSALSFLKENFTKDRVDVMEQYLKSEKSMTSKARKRYVKVPSGKRARYLDGLNAEFAMTMQPQEGNHTEGMQQEPMMPMI